MARPYSVDLRERVAGAVFDEGLSRHNAARRFGVAVSTAINWAKRLAETGRLEPGQMGGHCPKKISGPHRDWLVQRCQERKFTLRGLIAELAERGFRARLMLGASSSSTRPRLRGGAGDAT
jgi:putative transposase